MSTAGKVQTRERPPDGGVAARRAVVRWAWRLFRREWRQQALVLALLAVAVGGAVLVASVAYNVAPAQGDAEFGSAGYRYTAEGADPATVDATVEAAAEWFGAIEVIRRHEVEAPGLFEPVEVRAQSPDGRYGSPMLVLTDGRFPTADDEIAVTAGLADDFGVEVGDAVDFDGATRTVAGTVENPHDLDDEFALVGPDQGVGFDSVTILVDASADRVDAFEPPADATVGLASRSDSEGLAAAAGVLGVAEIILVLVSLIAAAGFVVVAQRRLRQLGMLTAIGATEKHLRLVMLANGAVVGLLAALIGTAAGLAAWFAALPAVERAARQRIDALDLPWWLIGAAAVLAVVTATASAWWPARVVARVPITLALSGRPPRPKPARLSVALAALCIVGGLAALAVAGDVADDYAVHWANGLLVATGTVAIIVGVLLVSPLAIKALAGASTRSPVPIRLALRDLARYQARSGVALAAISLALGIPVAVVISASAAEHGPAEGNLAANQVVIRTGDPDAPYLPDRTASELQAIEDEVDAMASGLDDAEVIGLDVVVDPGMETGPEGQPVITLGRRQGDEGTVDVALVQAATDELLEALDIGPVPDGTELITSETGDYVYTGALDRETGRFTPQPVTDVETIEPGYTSLPNAIMTTEGMEQRGWEPQRAAWLIQTPGPIDEDDLSAARDQAAAAGLTIEARQGQEGLARLRTGATAVGMLLALGVLAMTVGLMRSESARDLRTLTATGATSSIRRTLTAATAGGLALLGVLLGTAGAYLGLTAGYLDDIGSLTPVPFPYLAVIVAGVPAAAAAAGWVLAGREPATIARQPIE